MEFEDELAVLDGLIDQPKAPQQAPPKAAAKPPSAQAQGSFTAPKRPLVSPSAGVAPAGVTPGAPSQQQQAQQTAQRLQELLKLQQQQQQLTQSLFQLQQQQAQAQAQAQATGPEHAASALAKLWEAARQGQEGAQQTTTPMGFQPTPGMPSQLTPFGGTTPGFPTPTGFGGFPTPTGFGTPFGAPSLDLQLYLLQMRMQQEQLLAQQAVAAQMPGMFGLATATAGQARVPAAAKSCSDGALRCCCCLRRLPASLLLSAADVRVPLAQMPCPTSPPSQALTRCSKPLRRSRFACKTRALTASAPRRAATIVVLVHDACG
jgi:hypothetical protein